MAFESSFQMPPLGCRGELDVILFPAEIEQAPVSPTESFVVQTVKWAAALNAVPFSTTGNKGW